LEPAVVAAACPPFLIDPLAVDALPVVEGGTTF
jgi:hypothetical protein